MNLLQKFQAGGAIKVSDRASEKQHQQVLSMLAARGDFQQSIQIFPLEADDADGIDVSQFARAHGQRRGRNFNRAIGSVLAPATGFRIQRVFLPLPLPSSATVTGWERDPRCRWRGAAVVAHRRASARIRAER